MLECNTSKVLFVKIHNKKDNMESDREKRRK